MYNVEANTNSKYSHNPLPTIEAVLRSKGTFIGVTYKTLKGEYRYFNGRIGVRCKASSVTNGRYIKIYDVKLKQYRTLRREGIEEIRANGLKMSYKI